MQVGTRFGAILCLIFWPCLAAAEGACGSTLFQRLAVPDYYCFDLSGIALPGALCGAVKPAGFKQVHLGQACKEHDACYARAGSTKKQCDAEFRDLISRTCETTLSGPLRELGRRQCLRTADFFYDAVKMNGCDAFISAQRNSGVSDPVCTSPMNVGPFVGRWRGWVEGGGRRFLYEFDLREREIGIGGTVRISDPTLTKYAHYSIEADIDGDVIALRGVRFISRNYQRFCMASMTAQLYRNENEAVLRGQWGGLAIKGGCPMKSNGVFTLARVPE